MMKFVLHSLLCHSAALCSKNTHEILVFIHLRDKNLVLQMKMAIKKYFSVNVIFTGGKIWQMCHKDLSCVCKFHNLD